MSETSHTPGPWEIRESKQGEGVCIYAGQYGIGKVWNLNDNPENEANARLVAAAPELLVALKSARAIIQDDRDAMFESVTVAGIASTMDEIDRPHIDRLDAALADIDAAIAKASPSTRRDGPDMREGVA